MSIHIGKLIEQHLDAKRISRIAFAKMLGKHESGMTRLLERQHLHTSLLLKISQLLNHDFFQYYVADSQQEKTKMAEINKKMDDAHKKIEAMLLQTAQVQKENERLTTENNLLKEMFAMLKGTVK